MIPVIPVVVAGLGGLAWWRVKRKNYGKMTPARKEIFEKALKTLKDPVKLKKLADEFEKYGLKAEAIELRKRAALRNAPAPLKNKRTQAFKSAISSKDPQKVSTMANAFHKIGAYEAAAKLRKYATGLVPGGVPAPKAPVGE